MNRIEKLLEERVEVYHGSPYKLNVIKKGSWVTSNKEYAKDFGEEKAHEINNKIFYVFKLNIDEDNIDFDLISMSSGIDDERGTLLIDVMTSNFEQFEVK